MHYVEQHISVSCTKHGNATIHTHILRNNKTLKQHILKYANKSFSKISTQSIKKYVANRYPGTPAQYYLYMKI